MTGFGLHKHNYQSHIGNNDYDHCQMESASGECLMPALSTVHSENGYKDEPVGQMNYQKKENQVKSEQGQNTSISCVFEHIKDNKEMLSQ
jgi:hypothetical protein